MQYIFKRSRVKIEEVDWNKSG